MEKIPVLLVSRKQDAFVAAATATKAGQPTAIPMSEARVPTGVVLDGSFGAVALGNAMPGLQPMDVNEATKSATFVVRAFIESPDGKIPEEIEGHEVYSEPRIEPIITCSKSPPVGTAADVMRLLKQPALSAAGLDGEKVAIAIVDTGINTAHLGAKLGRAPIFDVANSWNGPGSTILPGQYPIYHGTMCAYDALIAAPAATLVDVPILSNRTPGGSSMAGTLAAAVLAYAHLLARWSVAFAPGDLGKYRGLVVNNSWGIYDPSWDFPPGHRGRYIDNPKHPFNLLVSVLVSAGADILFAAGNCGADCPDQRCAGSTSTICGSNAHGEVLTIAGCDCNDQRVGYSSQGPSIAGMPQQKPDITSYTHFIGSEAFGARSADSGTSAACPVVAGCIAALRTREQHIATSPIALAAQIRSTARQVQPNPPGWNGNYGHGILDIVAAGQSIGLLGNV